MRIPLSGILRRLDRYWLLNHPILWAMRLHWLVCFWILGLVLICLTSLLLPVSLKNFRFLNAYFWSAVGLAGLSISPWIYLQARLGPQLRQNPQIRNSVYLLAGYLFVLCVQSTLPSIFVLIIKSRILTHSNEREVLNDLQAIEKLKAIYSEAFIGRRNNKSSQLLNAPDWQDGISTLQELSFKYVGRSDPPMHSRNITPFDAYVIADSIASSIINSLNSPPYEGRQKLPHIILLLTILLRIFQMTDMKILLTTIFVGLTVGSALSISLSFIENKYIVAFMLLTFFAGAIAIFWAPRLKRKSVFFAVGMNIFTLLLPWVPSLPFFGLSTNLAGVEELFSGVALLFAVTPWVQRRYIALQAKPT